MPTRTELRRLRRDVDGLRAEPIAKRPPVRWIVVKLTDGMADVGRGVYGALVRMPQADVAEYTMTTE